MAINFNNATLLGYSHENIFLGDGMARRGSVKKLSIEGFFDARAGQVSGNIDSQGVKEVYRQISGFLMSANDFDDIILNGVNFGKGRITALDFEKENPVRIGEYSVDVEIYESGENYLFNISGPEYNGLKTALLNSGHLLENIAESFSFSVSEDNAYSYNHKVDVKYYSGIISDPILSAKNLAQILYSAQPALGFINSQYSGFYTGSGATVFSESYNLINNECSFSKDFSSLPNNSGTYSFEFSNEISIDELGIVNVSENGTVMGAVEPKFSSAKNGANAEITNSFLRCSGLVSAYDSFFSGNIHQRPIEVSKTFNSGADSVEYSVSYTNNPSIEALFFFDHSRNLSSEEGEIITVSEDGNITSYTPKGTGFSSQAASFLATAVSNTPSRCSGLYNSFVAKQGSHSGNLSAVSSSVNYSRFGKALTYSKSFSDDPSLVDVANLKKITITSSNNIPIAIHNSHLIPNLEEIIHDGNQTSEGSRTVNIEAQRKRVDGENLITSPPNINGEVSYLIGLSKLEMLKLFTELKMPINDMYITSLDYNFSSENTISLNLNASYVSERGQSDFNHKF